MKREEFNAYKKPFIEATHKLLATSYSENLDEAAFPAYSNPNPLINFLFWQRIYHTMQYIEQKGEVTKVLDFGCGSGVMLPFLAEQAEQVIGIDLDLEPLKKIKQYISFQENISIQETYQEIQENSLDLIIALDVLEHVDNLDKELEKLSELLVPDGEIIISGPTENLFYKLGRFLAGPRYSGDYHVRNIYDIRRATQKKLTVRNLVTLYPFTPLFLIYTAVSDQK